MLCGSPVVFCAILRGTETAASGALPVQLSEKHGQRVWVGFNFWLPDVHRVVHSCARVTLAVLALPLCGPADCATHGQERGCRGALKATGASSAVVRGKCVLCCL